MRGGFDHMKLVERKILAQNGQRHSRARGLQIAERALEKLAVGQHAQRSGASARVHSRDGSGIELIGQHALAGRRFLDFADDGGRAGGQRAAEIAIDPSARPRGVPARRGARNPAQARRAYVRQCGLRYRGLHAPFELPRGETLMVTSGGRCDGVCGAGARKRGAWRTAVREDLVGLLAPIRGCAPSCAWIFSSPCGRSRSDSTRWPRCSRAAGADRGPSYPALQTAQISSVNSVASNCMWQGNSLDAIRCGPVIYTAERAASQGGFQAMAILKVRDA